MSTYYVDQPIDIELTCTVDGVPMSTGVSAVISVLKPDRTEVEWTGVVDNVNGRVDYDAPATDIDMAGTWKMQPEVDFGGGIIIPGETVEMVINRRFT